MSVLRLHSLYIISVSKDSTCKPISMRMDSKTDFDSGDNVTTSIWSNIEVYLGIICASLPTIRPIIERLFPKAISRSRSGAPSLPTNNFGSHHNNTITMTSIRLDDVDDRVETVRKSQANERPNSWLRDGSDENRGKDIFVTISMKRDVESRGEMSEEDFIFQRP